MFSKGVGVLAVFLATALVVACHKDKSTPQTIQPPPPGPGTIAFALAAVSVAENAASVSIMVNRSAGTLGAVSVDYATSDGTATAGVHYTAASGTLTWSDGEDGTKTFTVPLAADDRTTEPDRTVALTLANVTGGAVLGANTATLTIADDDNPGTVGFSQLALSVNEDAGTATITVSRTGGNLGAVSVTCASSDGSALAGTDYTAVNVVLNWADADSAAKSCTVPILDDPDAELAETIQLALSSPSNGATLGAAGATLTINANDFPTASFLFYSASLHALDPASPANPVTVDSAARSARLIPHGLWDAPGAVIRDLHARSVIFESGGKLWRAGVRLRDGAPGSASNPAVQLSSDTGLGAGAKTICETQAFADYEDHASARVALRLAGTDVTCNTPDDQTRIVVLGSGAGDAPAALAAGTSIVSALRDGLNGSVKGWLLHDATARRLARAAADFTSVAPLGPSVDDHVLRLVATATHVFLDLDGNLYAYDSGSGSLASLHAGTAPDMRIEAVADNTDLYFHALGTNAIYRVPLDASSARNTVVSEGAGTSIESGVFLTAGRVVYVVADGSGRTLKSVAKNAQFASSRTIDSVTAPVGIQLFATAGDRLYYNLTGAAPRAATVRDDATGRITHDGAQWIGRSYLRDVPIGGQPGAARILLAEGFAAGQFAGGRVSSFLAETGDDGKELGVVDNDITALAGDGVGEQLLLQGNAAGGMGEVFRIDAGSAASLRRITTSPADERSLTIPVIPE